MEWARNNAKKAHAFGDYLQHVFQPSYLESTPEELEEIKKVLNETFQMKVPIHEFS